MRRTFPPRAQAFVITIALIVCSLGLLGFVLCGCAIAPMPDGSGYAVGMRMSGAGTSPQELAGTAGKVLGAFGVPGAPALGELVGGALGLLGLGGVGMAASARARRAGERVGWEEAAATYSPPPAGAQGAPAAGAAGGN